MNVKARQPQEATARTRRLLVILGGAVAAAVVVVFAIAIAGSKQEEVTYPNAVVQGSSLAPAAGDPLGVGDPVIGEVAPIIEGQDLDGTRARIGADGEPTVALLLAHWCPHCQRELPLVVDWLAQHEPATTPRVVAVATAIDPLKPNYPPEEWLEQEGWVHEVIYDAAGEVPEAYGSSGFPFFVVLDGEGKVVRRLSGEIDLAVLDEVLAGID